MRFWFLLLSVSVLSVTAQFRVDELYRAETFRASNGVELRYRVWAPERSPQNRQKYPVFVLMHGSGECGDDNRKQLMGYVTPFTVNCMKTARGAIVVLPQFRADAWPIRSIAFTPEYRIAADPAPSLVALKELCDDVVRRYSGDPDRVILGGLSLGGFTTWDAVMRWPDSFAAAVPVCAGGDSTQAARIRQVPIWTFHGEEDKNVSVECSRRMVQAIEACGGRVIYTEYPKTGHNAWDRAYADPALVQWMFKQNRTDRDRSFWRKFLDWFN